MIISKNKLIKDAWYQGSKRSRYPIAMWTGNDFISIGNRFGNYVVKYMDYWEKNNGCFEPVKLLYKLIILWKIT